MAIRAKKKHENFGLVILGIFKPHQPQEVNHTKPQFWTYVPILNRVPCSASDFGSQGAPATVCSMRLENGQHKSRKSSTRTGPPAFQRVTGGTAVSYPQTRRICNMSDLFWLRRCAKWSVRNRHSMYPLVNVYITMENHHCSWENSLFLWWFSIATLVITRGYRLVQHGVPTDSNGSPTAQLSREKYHDPIGPILVGHGENSYNPLLLWATISGQLSFSPRHEPINRVLRNGSIEQRSEPVVD